MIGGLNFMIVVNDNGELQSITATEIDQYPDLANELNRVLNLILDERVAREPIE